MRASEDLLAVSAYVIHVRIFISFAEASMTLGRKRKYCGHLHIFIFRP